MKKSLFKNMTLILTGVLIGALFFMKMDWVPAGLAALGDDRKTILLGNRNFDLKQFDNIPDPSPRFRAVSKEMLPTVVYIQVSGSAKTNGNPFRNDEFFKRFFPDYPQNEQPNGGGQRVVGSGSGVIVSDEGYILTNNHVVESADEDGLKVILFDKREFPAKLIGRDPQTDLAVIKIDAKDLEVAPLGDSDKLEVGDWVIAIGTPLSQNLSSTVTAGIISALGRNIGIIGDRYGIENFIQTDAAINPGNSGGPLIAMNGAVIGINSAIASSTGGYQGYGFAIPVNLAKKVATDLILDGKVKRGFVGVSMREMDGTLSKALGLAAGKGVLVQEVVADGPAEKAGIKQGDVILKVDGTDVSSGSQVQAIVASKRPGDAVKMVIWRDGKESSFTLTLVERNSLGSLASVGESGLDSEDEAVAQNASVSKLGVDLRPLTKAEMTKYKTETGLMVNKTKQNGFSDLAPGLVIVEVDRREVRSVDDVNSALSKKEKGDAVLLKVKTPDGQAQYIGVTIL